MERPLCTAFDLPCIAYMLAVTRLLVVSPEGLRIESRSETLYPPCMNAEFAPLFKLGIAERIQLVEDLWDSIARDDTQPSVSDEKRDELRRRKKRFLEHPASGRTWEQVKQQARSV